MELVFLTLSRTKKKFEELYKSRVYSSHFIFRMGQIDSLCMRLSGNGLQISCDRRQAFSKMSFFIKFLQCYHTL